MLEQFYRIISMPLGRVVMTMAIMLPVVWATSSLIIDKLRRDLDRCRARCRHLQVQLAVDDMSEGGDAGSNEGITPLDRDANGRVLH